MITLEKWDNEKRKSYKNNRPNNIECPRCKEELVDSQPGYHLAVYPPKTKVYCLNCHYQGERIV